MDYVEVVLILNKIFMSAVRAGLILAVVIAFAFAVATIYGKRGK